jgi:pyruvate formate lyase activating enzyme
LEFADLVLFDFKHLNPLKHLKFTGASNPQSLKNLRRLDEERIPLAIRIPVIPGFNATPEEMQSMANFAASLKLSHECHLLPYHAFGQSKYKHFGIESRFHLVKSPTSELMEEFREIWLAQGLNTRIGG